MSLHIPPQSGTSSDDVWAAPKESIDPNNNLSLLIKTVLKNSLESNIQQSEKKLLLKNLRSMESRLEMTNAGIENLEEIVQQVKEIISCLENNTSYAEKLWKKKKVQLNEGRVIFSNSLKGLLDDTSFEALMQAVPEKYQEGITDCCLDGLSLQPKSLETLLKYCPNIEKKTLEQIAATWKESDLSDVIEMWPLFNRVPLKERPNFVTNCLKCFHEGISGIEKSSIIIVITRISSQDRENIIKLALKCFHEGIPGFEKAQIITIIAQIPSEDRENIVELALQCFHEGIPVNEKIHIITTIASIPPEYRKDTIKWASKIFHEGISGFEKAQIITAIAQIHLEDQKNVIEWASKFFYAAVSGEEKAQIITAIAQIHPGNRENAVAWASKFFNEDIFGEEKAWITAAVALIPSEDRNNVVEHASTCFDKDSTGKEIMHLITTIAQISSQDRENVVEWTSKCFDEYATGEEKAQIIQAIAQIPPENRENVVEWSIKLFHEDITEEEKAQIITVIAQVPSQDRTDIIELASKYFHEDITGEEKAQIIAVIAQIPPENRQNIIELASKCFHEGISGFEKANIMATIYSIPLKDQKNVVEWSIKYFHEDISGEEKVQIIKAIASIPLAQRRNIIECSLRCSHAGISVEEKIQIIEDISQIDPEDRKHVIEWSIKCFHEGLSGIEKTQIIKAIAPIPFEHRRNVIERSIRHFSGMSGLEKAQIIVAIAQTHPEDRENVIEWSSKCFHEGISGFEKASIIAAIAQTHPEDRENVIEWSTKYFHEGISGFEKASIIAAIAQTHPEDRENIIEWSTKCFHEGIPGFEKAQIIKAIAQTHPEDRENVIEWSSKCFHEGISGFEKASIITVIAQTRPEDRKNVIELTFKCSHEATSGFEKASIITAIALIQPEDRENAVEWSIKCFHKDITGNEKIEILKAISIIPNEERSFIDDSLIQNFSKSYGLNRNILLNTYLLPVTIRSEEALLDPDQYSQELIASLEQKLSNETLPPKTLIGMAEYADERYGPILLEEHPLMQRVIELLAINAIEGTKNPFSLFGKLKALRNIPVDFQTPVSEVIPLRINMARLKDMSMASTIKREDLPEKATKEAWESLKNAFKERIEMDLEKAKEALGQLGTTWDDLEGTLLKDSQNYLSGLFDLTGPVSDSEAKFKAVFNNILSKNNDRQNGQFFTEQEEVLIKTIMTIQHCKGGKQGGIADAYQLLDAPYKYKLQLSPPMSVEERSDLERKEEATQFLRDFVQEHPITEEELIRHFKTDIRTNAGLFTALFGAGSSDKYLIEVEEDDDFVFHLNEAGAHEALSYIHDVEKKNLTDYIADIVRPVMERTISNDTFIEKLAEEATPHGVHSTIYLKNTIGHLIGVTNELIFDRYTTVLSDALLEKSREELLKLLFTQVTPETLVSKLVRMGVPAVYMKLFLDEEKLTKESAENLLKLTGYLE